MLIDPIKLRRLCNTQEGAIESRKFAQALKKSISDPVAVEFTIDFNTVKTFHIPRIECEQYAKIVADENRFEDALLEHINPIMQEWARNNRDKMCAKIEDAKEGRTSSQFGYVIVWPLCPPDNIPIDEGENYLKKYSNQRSVV